MGKSAHTHMHALSCSHVRFAAPTQVNGVDSKLNMHSRVITASDRMYEALHAYAHRGEMQMALYNLEEEKVNQDCSKILILIFVPTMLLS